MSKQPSHPIVSCGDLNSDSLGSASINKPNTPVLDAALKEMKKNHVSGGGGRFKVAKKDYSYSFFNPHNARYYFDFDKSTLVLIGSAGVGGGRVELKPINGGKEFCLKNFFSCRVVVKKNKIEITNKVDKERIYRIEGNAEERRMQFVEALTTLELECIDVLKRFIAIFGGSSSMVCCRIPWIPDNKIMHEKFIDTIPMEQTFRNDVVKKVYNTKPKNAEFGSPAYASNYMRNSGLHDYCPEIAKELEDIRLSHAKELKKFTDEALIPLTEQIKTHLAVQHSSLRVHRQMSRTLRYMDGAASLRIRGSSALSRFRGRKTSRWSRRG